MARTSLDAIRRVVAAFEQSDWSEIDVRAGDVRVHLVVGAPGGAPTASAPVASLASAPEADAEPAAVGPPDVTSTPPSPNGAQLVVAPSPGIFWRSPEPGAPPFADVGDSVDASATVCIIEVMKLMSHVKAGVTGEVIAVYGDNGVAVQKGAPLFAIAPAEPSP